MTKQEEIREGMHDLIGDCLIEIGCGDTGCPKAERLELEAQEKLLNNILSYLHSQGVVIKVDRELPDNKAWHKVEREFEAYCAGKNDLIGAGYVAVEPLLEVENG